MAIPEYKLSTVLHGHSSDVRCVSITKDECILSSSRDKTAKLWHPEGAKDFAAVVTYKGHSNFVSSICYLPPCEAHPDGLVVTASNDTTICAYNVQDPIPLVILKGHENVVCNISPGKIPGTVLSASWDCTGRVWSLNILDSPILILRGHLFAVWAIIELGNDGFATGSADKTIILWDKNGDKIKSLTGHTDCVRALAVASVESFLSCGNDASIRLWSNKGDCLNTYFGHSNYIYSICVNPFIKNSFVTCGEDSTVRVWLAGDNVCTLALPAQSVWSVVCLSNGDIVAGSSDGLVRVFSADALRYADDCILKTFEQEVSKLQEASLQEIGGVKVTDLPGPEVLFEPGKSDGQTKLVRKGTSVKCYSWSNSTKSWTEVGDVMGAAGASEGKTMHEGKEYDFVFSVDIEDGKPPLKLPYNLGEDPWVSSQAFIHKNNLPQVYLEQVANFILKNSNQDSNTISTATTGDFMDPFTGGSRYVPGTGPVGVGQAGKNADPFTGASSYSTNPSKAPVTPTLFPQKTYLRFDQGNISLILNKLKEFNAKSGCAPLTDNDLEEIVKLTDIKSDYSPGTVNKLKQILEWPQDFLFPVLDITRLAIRNLNTNADLFNKELFGHQLISLLLDSLVPGRLPANQLLSLRVLTNAFAHLDGEMIVLEMYENILSSLMCLPDPNKNIQIAASTLLLNLCVALGQLDDTTQLCNCVLQMLVKFIDDEAYFRGLVALGTLIIESSSKIHLTSMVVSDTLFMQRLKKSALNDPNADINRQKIITCAQQIIQIL